MYTLKVSDSLKQRRPGVEPHLDETLAVSSIQDAEYFHPFFIFLSLSKYICGYLVIGEYRICRNLPVAIEYH